MNHHAPQRGQVILLALVFLAIFLMVSSALVSRATQYAASERHVLSATQALQLADAGVEQAIYNLGVSPSYTGESNTALGNGTFTTTVTSVDGATQLITATGVVTVNGLTTTRKIKVKVSRNGAAVTFKYGTQAGQGGIIFNNNSGLVGNLYSNGNIVGSNGAYITGEAWVAGSTGSISNMCIGASNSQCTSATSSDAHAHSITSTNVTGAVYCQTGSGNNKICNTSQSDPLPADYPISDANITDWKNNAAAGTVINGDYTISSNTVTLGPTKINGNLTVSGTGTLVIANTIWVTGNILFTNNSAKIKLATTYGAQSGVIISDGLVSITNNVVFQDSGTSGSYIMLLTTSNCDSSIATSPCTGKDAISVGNNAAIVIANAQQGTVSFSNNASVKEVVGKKIRLNNNSVIQYGSGLPNTLFQSGTGGSYVFVPGTYSIVH